jgi:stage II sporulation protein D
VNSSAGSLSGNQERLPGRAKSVCDVRPQGLARRWFLAPLIFCLLLLGGCGRHKASVRVPIPTPSAPSTSAENPAAKPVPPATSGPAEPRPKPESAAEIRGFVNMPGPQIRIGLTTTAREIRISSSGAYAFTEKKPETAREPLKGEILVRLEQEIEETIATYRIQVGSFSRMETAQELQKKLSDLYAFPVIIHENPSSGARQVRVGEFTNKEDAQEFLRTLIETGYRDAFMVKEAPSSGGGKMTLALRGAGNLFRLSSAGFLFFPPSGTSYLRLDGKPYRGLFDVFLNPGGQITVVNQLGMEEYLLGVVPAEISPTSYPAFAALAAQAIAARTYALKNMGQYRSEGFDLTPDAKSQVYTGVSGEKDATNDAVRQTAGVAIYYQGSLIDAMYMSTCGGKTEDFSNVFDAPPVPYLKSVFCAVENGSEKGETVLSGTHELEQVFLSDDGSLANRNLEFARILGISDEDSGMSAESLASPAAEDEVVRWVDRARKIASKFQQNQNPSRSEIATRAGFLRYAAESLFGSDEIKRRISPSDVEYYLGNLRDGSNVPESARYALSYLMQAGLWRPSSDNGVQPKARIRRGEALFLLLRWVESARPEIMRKGTFVGSIQNTSESDPSIRVKWGSQTQDFPLSGDVHLFRHDSGRITPVTSVQIIGNEKLIFHLNALGAIDLMEVELNPTGAASDRYSPVATWDVTFTRAAIGEKLRALAGNIGEFQDLKPSRIGNSGRAVQIQVAGSRGSAILNGYKVRNALGLRDTLFTISREHNPDGSISAFTFHGRGWGHGVGLCQVGAFGMAKAGRSYEEILKTYYQGVQIRKAY